MPKKLGFLRVGLPGVLDFLIVSLVGHITLSYLLDRTSHNFPSLILRHFHFKRQPINDVVRMGFSSARSSLRDIGHSLIFAHPNATKVTLNRLFSSNETSVTGLL